MANSNRTKDYEGDDPPTYHFTSYQLVMLICAALLLMLLVFMAGSFVRGMDGSGNKVPQDSVAGSLDKTQPETKKPEKPKPISSANAQGTVAEGVQISPRPVSIPSGTPPGAASSKPQADATKPPAEMKTARDTGAAYIPAPPPSRAGSQTPAAAPVAKDAATEPKPEVKAGTPGGEPKPVKVPDAANAQPPAATTGAPVPPAAPAANPKATDAKTPPAPATPPAAQSETAKTSDKPSDKTQIAKADTPAPSVTAQAASPKGGYTVQVASFEAKKKDVVDAYVKRIKSNSDFEVRVLPTSDGSRLRICIGQYADKKSADKARDDLRSVKEFEKCWVLALSE